jgi:DNA-binding response OmpR family regulator
LAELLLIDNDRRIVELLVWMLERNGHRVRTASTFAQARRLIVERMPALMLSDLELGSENGRRELPELARDGLLPPTLVVSGYLDGELERLLAAIPGVVGTLAKPFDFAVLERRIQDCLREGAGPAVRSRTIPAADPIGGDDGWIEILPARRNPDTRPGRR